MGLFGWILTIIFGVIFFLVIHFLEVKFTLTKLEKFVFSILCWMVLAGFFSLWGKNTENIFLVFVFQMIADVVYSSYFIERDFFDREEGNLLYYVGLILVGFFFNQVLINQVERVFLTGEDYRLLLWGFLILFIYYFFKNHSILAKNFKKDHTFMSRDMILTSYAKLKDQYFEDCDFKDSTFSNLVYAFMIYENHKRSKVLRDLDYFLFRLKGDKRKLGIMQVETSKYISDSESIELFSNELKKFYIKGKGKKSTPEEVISKYALEDASKVQSIFDIIRKF